MFSLFKTRYHLLADFPSVSDARFYILSENRVGILLVFREGSVVDHQPISAWLSKFQDFNEYVIVNESPELIYEKQDILEEAASLELDPDSLVDQRTYQDAFVHFLETKLSCSEVQTLTGFDGWGSISLFLSDSYYQELNEEIRGRIVRLVHLILGSSIRIHLHPLSSLPVSAPARSEIEKLEQEDWQICLDLFSDALEGTSLRSLLPPFYEGNGIYVDAMTSMQDLYPLLSMGKVLFVTVPFNQASLEKKFQTSFEEVSKTMKLKRIIPVFEERLDRYDKKYALKLLESAPRVILPGELRLRLASAMHNIEPFLPFLERRGDHARRLVQLSETESTPLAKYVQAVQETSKRYRHCMTMLEPTVKALFPMVEYVDQLVREQLNSQGKVYKEKILEFAAAYRVWLYSHALNSEASVAHNDSLLPYMYIYFGNDIDRAVKKDLLVVNERIQWILGRLGMVSKEISLSEHAEKPANDKILDALRRLLDSPRMQSDDYKVQLEKIELEVEKLKSALSIKQWGFFLVSVLSGSLSLAYGADNPILQYLFGASLLKTLPNAPKVLELLKEIVSDPEETAMTKLLRFGTPEARLLLKVRGH